MKRIATIGLILTLVAFAFADVNVTFRVNTSTMSQGVTDSTAVMHIRGDMNGWGDGNPMTNVGGDYWETTISLAAGDYGYKFTYTDELTGGLAWESIDNRSVTVGTEDMVVDLAYFDNVAPYTPTEDIDVYFRVNTAGIPGYAGETINVRGGLAPLDWGTSIALEQEEDTEFWSGVISFPAANAGTEVEYKFLKDEGWEGVDNRKFTLNADTTLAFKYFDNAPPVSEIDTFEVKIVMNTSNMKNVTDSTALFFVTGSYDGWVHEDDTLTQVGDYCSKTFNLVGAASGLDMEFTFFYKMLATIDVQNWYGGSNFTPTITSDTTLVYYWQNGTTPPYTPTDSIDVWFRVNMAGVADFDPETQVVGIRGAAPLDWGVTHALTQEEDSDYYSGQFSFGNDLAGTVQEYKFVYGDSPNWESLDNRTFTLNADTTLAFKYFNDEPPLGVDPVTHYVVFQVDMGAYIELGLFSEARKDSMQVRGGFNGWTDGDPLKSKMTKTPGTSVYTLAAEVTDFPDAEINYKYFMKLSQESLDHWKNLGIDDVVADWGYEVPPTMGGGNRSLIFSDGTDYQVLDVEYYQGLQSEGIIPDGTTIPVTFSMDMNGVEDFNAATDSVIFHFKDEWQVNAFGLRDSVLVYSDANSDGIYELTIDWVGPCAYTMIYTVSYDGPEGGIEEGGGFDFGRFRCRYIQPVTKSPVTWPSEYSVPTDIFTIDPPLDVEESPFGTVAVDDKDENIVSEYQLSQNYPNPFNPVTTINFRIKDASKVSLTIYNMLGQKIQEVSYTNMNAGQYNYKWNAVDMNGARVGSGIYFYKLQVDDKYSDMKKMVLLK